ncbi:MAG TPA: PBSX family phage terminase large subunit [Acidimicrobiia bacterium]|nr:PBSX family phage terminase large subunit [Acidimicrobiia bacterium]
MKRRPEDILDKLLAGVDLGDTTATAERDMVETVLRRFHPDLERADAEREMERRARQAEGHGVREERALVPGVDLPQYAERLDEKWRYKVLYGGRGGAKSWTVAAKLVEEGARTPIRVLCTREVQATIKDSVHKLLKDTIGRLGYLRYRITDNSIKHPIGTEFIFKGLHDPDGLKSAEGVDRVWIEEAQRVTAHSWSVLPPTIRKPGSQIYVVFNPDLESDPTYQRFVVNPREDALLLKVGWEDNPWFAETELPAEKDHDYRVDPDLAAHIWEGEVRKGHDAQILKNKYVSYAFEPQADWDGPYQGLDFGFAVDPTVSTRCWMHGRRLYVEYEAYRIGLELDETAEFLCAQTADFEKYVTRADSAEAQAISYLKRKGLPKIDPVDKWSGSVEDGIRWFRQLESIVVHPRCAHTLRECRLYSYKTDRRTGDVLPEIVDAHNHCIDSIRYGLQPVIKYTKKKVRAWTPGIAGRAPLQRVR